MHTNTIHLKILANILKENLTKKLHWCKTDKNENNKLDVGTLLNMYKTDAIINH